MSYCTWHESIPQIIFLTLRSRKSVGITSIVEKMVLLRKSVGITLINNFHACVCCFSLNPRLLRFLLFWSRIAGDATKMTVMKRLEICIMAFPCIPFSPYMSCLKSDWENVCMVTGSSKWDCLDSSSSPNNHRSCIEQKWIYLCWQEVDWWTKSKSERKIMDSSLICSRSKLLNLGIYPFSLYYYIYLL